MDPTTRRSFIRGAGTLAGLFSTRIAESAARKMRMCLNCGNIGVRANLVQSIAFAANFGFDVDAWMREAPLERVVQIHVAGHEWFSVDEGGLGTPASAHARDALIIDTHGADVADPVLSLLSRVLVRTGRVPVVLERDQNVPSLDALLDELSRVRAIWERAGARG